MDEHEGYAEQTGTWVFRYRFANRLGYRQRCAADGAGIAAPNLGCRTEGQSQIAVTDCGGLHSAPPTTAMPLIPAPDPGPQTKLTRHPGLDPGPQIHPHNQRSRVKPGRTTISVVPDLIRDL